MKVLITGVAGLIGSHLAKRFIDAGYFVYGVDNFITGSRKNLEGYKKENFKLIEADVIEDAFDPKENIDGVLHFASPASPMDFTKIPMKIVKVNTTGTERCLELAKKYDATFLMASTSEVYGDPLEHPQKETYLGNVSTTGVRSVYDESKRLAESITYSYQRQFNTAVRVVRIFNTYGPGMRPDDGRVIPAFISQVIEGKPLTVFGDGSQTRSFCYVSDLCEGIYRLFKSGYTRPVNIGNPDERTIMELVKELEKLKGGRLEVEFQPLPQGDPAKRCPDISRAKEILGWKPQVSLFTGLEKTYRWFEERLSHKVKGLN